jgi:hypothetical protein
MKPVKTAKKYIRFYYLRQSEDIVRVRRDLMGRSTEKIVRAGTPLALIGSTVDRDKGVIRFALAIVHPDDNFCKKTARNYVKANLIRRPFTTDLPRDAKGYEINCAVMNAILSDEENDHIVDQLEANKCFAPKKRGAEERTIAEWAYGHLQHTGLRKLANEWLARPRWEEKTDLIQQVKDALVKNSEVKSDPKLIFAVLVETGYFDVENASNEDKVMRFDLMHKLLVEETQVKATG